MKNQSHQNLLRSYFRAKDDNKPHLMPRVFSDSATLAMKLKTDAISFPADSVGLEAITDVLVKNFSQSYENVYTFCLTDSVASSTPNDLSCDWLVCMTDRADGNVRVGCGRYDWVLNDANTLVTRLVITIEEMQVLTPNHYPPIMEWIEKLAYPFCDAESVLEGFPELESLQSIKSFFEK